jgi:hypothetical protein
MMHHGMPLQYLSSKHMQRTSMGAAKALFCKNLMEACEAREYGSDSKQRNKEGWSALEKIGAKWSSRAPRPAGLPIYFAP